MATEGRPEGPGRRGLGERRCEASGAQWEFTGVAGFVHGRDRQEKSKDRERRWRWVATDIFDFAACAGFQLGGRGKARNQWSGLVGPYGGSVPHEQANRRFVRRQGDGRGGPEPERRAAAGGQKQTDTMSRPSPMGARFCWFTVWGQSAASAVRSPGAWTRPCLPCLPLYQKMLRNQMQFHQLKLHEYLLYHCQKSTFDQQKQFPIFLGSANQYVVSYQIFRHSYIAIF